MKPDAEAPTIECPEDTAYVQQYMPLNIAIPPQHDNTGILSMESNFTIGTPVTEDMTVTFKATDFNGNTARCDITVIMLGKMLPIFGLSFL